MATDDKSNGDAESDAAIGELAAMVAEMLAHRDGFQARSRAWISSREFAETYEDLHPGLLFKCIATLLGSGKSFLTRSSKLNAGYQRLALQGELLFASMVIGNRSISDKPHLRFPAALVASRSQDVASVVQIAMLGHALADAYMGDPSSEMPKCQRMIADDNYRPLRQRSLPAEETGGISASLFDVRISATELFQDEDAYPFVPLLVNPDGGPFVVVPWAVLHGRAIPSRATAAPPSSEAPPPLPKAPPPLPRTRDSHPGETHEVTPGGSTILRHQLPEEGFVLADMSGNAAEAIESHIDKCIGKANVVFHELVSHRVHLDVHYVPPTPERPYNTLVTSGMSDLPMTVPAGAEHLRFAELMLCLPADWNLAREQLGKVQPQAFEDERNYWPVRWLKKLARFPHDFGTWLGTGHTIPNGDPAQPLTEGLPFTGFLISMPTTTPDEFHQLRISPEKTIRFYSIIPLTTAEMDFKLQHGLTVLVEQLEAHGVTELVDPDRKSVV